jgi:hypothetical protein
MRLEPTAVALAKGWHVPAAVAVIVLTAAGSRFLPVLVPLPRMFSYQSLSAPASAIAALLVSVAAFLTADEPSDILLLTSPRRSQLLNPSRVFAVGGIGAMLLCVGTGASWTPTLSSVAALVGEGLLLGSLVGIRLAWVLPTLHVLAALTFGAAGRSDLAPWAWILATHPSTSDLSASTVLLAIGSVKWLRRRPQ